MNSSGIIQIAYVGPRGNAVSLVDSDLILPAKLAYNSALRTRSLVAASHPDVDLPLVEDSIVDELFVRAMERTAVSALARAEREPVTLPSQDDAMQPLTRSEQSLGRSDVPHLREAVASFRRAYNTDFIDSPGVRFLIALNTENPISAISGVTMPSGIKVISDQRAWVMRNPGKTMAIVAAASLGIGVGIYVYSHGRD